MIAKRAIIADTAISRLVGLLNRSSLNEDEALVITDCRSIHMFFMRFPIDVIFVDRAERVIGIVKNIKPFQVSPYFWRSRYVVELFPGAIESSQTMLGDLIQIEK
ncbi:MAG: DUF192 domain-containing protein [Candidatus Omnitrophica bacterium]|nr:DUF192 domain-containing protein [Candidatus Omnitrophota bacterium]